MMNPEIKKRWVEALRSGKYIQGKGQLFDGHAMCCLAVLCDVVKDEVGLVWARRANGDRIAKTGDDWDIAFLPIAVINHAGLERTNPRIVYNNARTDLASLNDRRVSFAQIADLIEAQL